MNNSPDTYCFMCGHPLYGFRSRSGEWIPLDGFRSRTRAWVHLHWRETLHGPRRVDPVCTECMRIGEALRAMFMYLRAAVFPRFSRRSFRFRIPQLRLLTHHHKQLL
jgi:hypothetical protein